MSRTFAAILLVVVLVIGGGAIATAAYQAGVSNAVTTGAAPEAERLSHQSSSRPTAMASASGIRSGGCSGSSRRCSSSSSCSA